MRIRAWEEIYSSPRSLPEMLRWGVTHLPLITELVTRRRLLEVGTGTGMLSALVSRLGPTVMTLDNSSAVLASAQRFSSSVGAPVTRVRGDALFLPFRSRAFDACFSQGLLEHSSDDDVEAMVAEQLRVAPVVYASVPSVFYPHVGARGPGLVGNERLLGRRRWVQILGRFDVDAEYYSDFKIASFAGWTVPWPAQLLLRVSERF